MRLTKTETNKLVQFAKHMESLQNNDRLEACQFMKWLVNEEVDLEERKNAIRNLNW